MTAVLLMELRLSDITGGDLPYGITLYYLPVPLRLNQAGGLYMEYMESNGHVTDDVT